MRKVAQFDLDYTLILDNSFFSFVEYLLVKKLQFHKLLFIKFLYIFDIVGVKVGGKDLRFYYTRMLRGFNFKEIDRYSKRYVEKTYSKFLVTEVLNLRKIYFSKGYEIILITATIFSLAKHYADKLGISTFYASELEIDENNKCTGLLKVDLFNSKPFIKPEIDTVHTCVISDNIEDYNAKNFWTKFVAIVINGRNADFWESRKDIEIIKVYKHLYSNQLIFPPFYYLRTRSPFADLFFSHIPFFIGVAYLSNYPFFFNLLNIIICWFLYITLYEIGYIINDFISVRYEKVATFRVYRFKINYVIAIFLRIITLVVVVLLLDSYFLENFPKFVVAVLAAALILFIFIIHNLIPKRIRLITYTLIKPSHLLVPIIFSNIIVSAFISIFLFYLPTELVYYFRKVTHLPELPKLYRRFYIPLFKMVVLLFVFILALSLKGNIFSQVFLLGLLISLKDILALIKHLILKII